MAAVVVKVTALGCAISERGPMRPSGRLRVVTAQRSSAFVTPLSGSESLLRSLVGVVCDVRPPLPFFVSARTESGQRHRAPAVVCICWLCAATRAPICCCRNGKRLVLCHLTTASCYAEIQDGDSSSLQ